MSRFWSQTSHTITPYVPGEQPQDRKYIKLNTNENPYPPSPLVLKAINENTDDTLRLYPDPECSLLREAIALYYGVNKEEVFVGNGSDEILAFSFMAFFMPDRPLIYPDITYTFYDVYASLFRIQHTIIPLQEDFTIDIKPYCTDGAGIILANPNAPTGISLSIDEIEIIAKKNKNNLVIIDEAYVDFGGTTSIPLIKKYDNLLVIQTFSKSRSLAGLRVGFAIGQRDLIQGLMRVKNSFNSYPLDRLAIVGAIASIKDDSYFQQTRQKIINTREQVYGKLTELGFKVLTSKANFIFMTHKTIYAEEILNKLRQRGILVRHFNRPRIDNYLRVTIGKDDEMDTLIDVLKEIVGENQKI
ncbi:MAG: histidinol-phosphate transaminase [Thermodesulfovibrionales bacterium]|nr:histidinol-phosphate transaminase [Thermodesulfovibrionales bacterium]